MQKNEERRNWTKEEIVLALCLYYRIENGDFVNKTQAYKNLAKMIGRSYKSVECKIQNLLSCSGDSGSGYNHINKLDDIVYKTYQNDIEQLFEDGMKILANINNQYEDEQVINLMGETPYCNSRISDINNGFDFKGEDVFVTAKHRKQQWVFRTSLMSAYKRSCCISGMNYPQLLVASHIVPWSEKQYLDRRLDPRNGLLLNALLDRAFDKGIITINPNTFAVIVSRKVNDDATKNYLNQYKGKQLMLPSSKANWPLKENLEYHNDKIFIDKCF